ncbi:MAG: stage 0 sporulation family protein [Nitrospirota bacterium]
MPEVIGIRFKNCGKIYDFEVNGIEASSGDLVVVESEFGLSIGSVVIGRHILDNQEKVLKKVLRLATEEDIRQKQDNELFEKEARDFCFERIMARGIPMNLVCAEVTLDRKRIVFYFTAEGRIDFRELVKDLAAKFKTRIEMRQIGVRDKAKFIGGLGLCGKEICCRLFLTSFEPISIKMAKQQELVLNTSKLSGICGRLMCCLGYEYDDFVPDSSLSRDEQIVPLAGDEMLEIFTEEPQVESSEIICCSAGKNTETPASQSESTAGQEVAADSRPNRRRRRRRRRRGRFHKKSE